MICITEYRILKLLQSTTLTKVYEAVLKFNASALAITVRDLTKYLRYKNKSTVSRALKVLRADGFIDKDNNPKLLVVSDSVIF